MKYPLHLLTVLFIIMAVSISAHAQTATTPSGTGTSGDPYLIASLENLYWLSQTETVWDDGAYFRQTADIDASETSGWDSGQGFSPIGTQATPFTGTYDGDGFTITGLFIDRTSGGVGLFGYIVGATVLTDIGLLEVDISGGGDVGGLVGDVEYSSGSSFTISGSYTTGTVSSSGSAGGLLGHDGKGGGTFTNNYSTADVSSTGSDVGGLIGYTRGPSVSNSYATGNVTGTHGIGGLIGVFESGGETVSKSYATGHVSGLTGIGGLIGVLYYSNLSNSYATGNVNGNTNTGGLVGDYEGDTSTMTNSYASGNVSEGTRAGGLVGSSYDVDFSNNYWNTEASGQSAGLGNGTTPAGMTGLTSAQMRQQASYSGFNFSGTWTISEDTTFAWLQFHEPGFLPGIGTQAAGAGTSTDPYQIAILDNLYWFSQNTTVWDAWFQQTADIDASATSTWDSGAGFSPIGSPFDPFSGTYNGDGYTITGLFIDRSSGDYIGFFGFSAARLSNIGLVNVDITGPDDALYGSVGGLVATAVSDTISNSYTSGTVTGNKRVGGLIGQTTSNTTSIANYSTSNVQGGSDIGGLIGSSAGSVSYSYATGTVSGTGDNIGGLIGNSASGSVANSFATGAVNGNDQVGGLTGISGAPVSNSYATGRVTGVSNVGGLAGYSVAQKTNSFATGSVTGTSKVGGLFGSNNKDGAGLYWNTQTSGQSVANGSGTTTGMTGLTTGQMIDSASFSGWDFASDTAWTINSGFTFPYLPNTSDHRIVVATIDGGEGWRMIGHPGDLTYREFLDPIWTQGYEGADSESGSPNVYFYSESTQSWMAPSSASDYFGTADSTTENTALNGILLYVYADDDADGNDDSWPKYLLSENSNLSKSYDISLSYTDNVSDDSTGWNMVSNPYPVSLDWTEVVTNEDITNTFPVAYIWDDSLNSGEGAYRINYGYPLPPGLPQDLIFDGPIPAMQAFWVKATASGASLGFKPDYQGSNQKLYKSRPDDEQPDLPWLSLTIENSNFSDQVIFFGESEDLQGYNVPKLETIASRFLEFSIETENTSWISHSLGQSDQEIPLNLTSTETGSFTLSWETDKIFFDRYEATLVDQAKGISLPLQSGEPYIFEMTEESNPKLSLRVATKNTVGNEPGNELPTVFVLNQNYPNPFNPSTVINYQLPISSKVTLKVFDVLGREVAVLVNTKMEAGYHQIQFNANNLASGMYIYRLEAGNNVFTKKLILIK